MRTYLYERPVSRNELIFPVVVSTLAALITIVVWMRDEIQRPARTSAREESTTLVTTAAPEPASVQGTSVGSANVTFEYQPAGNNPQFINVRYITAKRAPADTKPFLLVRDPLGQYFSWGILEPGEWRTVQLGDRDSSGTFETGIVYSSLNLPKNEVFQNRPPGVYAGRSLTR